MQSKQPEHTHIRTMLILFHMSYNVERSCRHSETDNADRLKGYVMQNSFKELQTAHSFYFLFVTYTFYVMHVTLLVCSYFS